MTIHYPDMISGFACRLAGITGGKAYNDLIGVDYEELNPEPDETIAATISDITGGKKIYGSFSFDRGFQTIKLADGANVAFSANTTFISNDGMVIITIRAP